MGTYTMFVDEALTFLHYILAAQSGNIVKPFASKPLILNHISSVYIYTRVSSHSKPLKLALIYLDPNSGHRKPFDKLTLFVTLVLACL